jgi:hypothetical protein
MMPQIMSVIQARFSGVPVVSGHALAVTFGWLAAAMVVGATASIPLARTVAAARAQAA